jgi:ABC-2 type transport system ATP-binding protein
VGSRDVIVTSGLTKFYGKARGVEDLDLEVRAGEVFGYLGPNGAGKTTTIRTLLDLMRPTRGSATIFGLDAHAGSVDIRRRTGYLPGELALYENLSSAEYLGYFANLRGNVEWGAAVKLADRMQLDMGLKIKSLSHGNRQKAALIQAFMHTPDLLVLDEPTQGLDPLVQQEFYALVDEARAAGRTVFISSHVMPEIEKLCDRVGIIRDGRLVEIADVGELKSKALRTIEIHFAGEIDASAFTRIEGIRDLEIHGDSLRCSIAGPMDPLVKAAARFDVVNIETREASLEDIFLAFYGKGANHADHATP